MGVDQVKHGSLDDRPTRAPSPAIGVTMSDLNPRVGWKAAVGGDLVYGAASSVRTAAGPRSRGIISMVAGGGLRLSPLVRDARAHEGMDHGSRSRGEL